MARKEKNNVFRPGGAGYPGIVSEKKQIVVTVGIGITMAVLASKTVGSTMSVSSVEMIMPPMTTVSSRFER